MSRDIKVYIRDILHAIEKIETYTSNFKKESLYQDEKTLDAVVRNLEIIGEASKKIPDVMKSRYTEIEWKKIMGLRDILIHEYFGIDYEIIWDIVKHKLPEFKSQIQQILTSINK